MKAILLVEDNADDVDLTMRAFRKGGMSHRVTVVHDGVEALEFLFAAGERAGRDDELPRLVLLDLKLPRLNG